MKPKFKLAMKQKLLLFLFLSSYALLAQVGIGTTTPNGALEVTSANDGMVVPRVALSSTTDAATVQTLVESELVYNTATVSDLTPGYYYWDGVANWIRINPTASNDWTLTGNAGTLPGTWAAPGTNFIGTTDAQDMFFRTNNQNRLRILSNGRMEFGPMSANPSTGTATYYFSNEPTNTSNFVGINNKYENSCTGSNFGFYNRNISLTAGSNGHQYGFVNVVSGLGNGLKTGISNTIFDTQNVSGGSVRLIYNATTIGSTNTNASIEHLGVHNHLYFRATGRGILKGVYNDILTPSGSTHTEGIFGVHNMFTIRSSGTTYGSVSQYSTGSTGTGDKYGFYALIPNGLAGTHYGMYSDVTNASGYAGYFLGRVSIGTTAGNEYILPASRGTNGQVMTTDGAGNVSWTSSSSSTLAFDNASVAATFTVTSSMYTVRVANAVTDISLPDPTIVTGKVFVLIGTNGITAKAITVTGGASVIDDVTNTTITNLNANERYTIQSDGTNWIVIGN
ncbi:hypothetical protein GFJ94_11315 [Flavobacterium sp. LMO8]|uniref:hypothetical protein n=1 Tax=Flavobacterium sp. LMO8 TaxID=2654244 RepID=UPI0012909982|nr:hypothetical protein [Flavobacterium sp. LMO8]MQP25651.1 hypothetical protein [Flavobacterium sp. LMO8]